MFSGCGILIPRGASLYDKLANDLRRVRSRIFNKPKSKLNKTKIMSQAEFDADNETQQEFAEFAQVYNPSELEKFEEEEQREKNRRNLGL